MRIAQHSKHRQNAVDRAPQGYLDVEWFVEGKSCASLGRGLELTDELAYLPIARTLDFSGEVTLHVALPGQAQMFRAKGKALPGTGRIGWTIRFEPEERRPRA